jgi:hypothetical protein
MIPPLILLILAGAAKAVQDLAVIGALNWGPFWNELEAWKYKWKRDSNGQPIIPLEEVFLGSSTVFVFTRSGFHAAQFVFLNSLIVGTVLITQHFNIWFSLLAASAVPRVTFEIVYRQIKKG